MAANERTDQSAREGAYTRQVERELRTRCVHLLTKEAFIGLPSAHEEAFAADEPIWWCEQTGEALGPDGSAACRRDCHGPGRACYTRPEPDPDADIS